MCRSIRQSRTFPRCTWSPFRRANCSLPYRALAQTWFSLEWQCRNELVGSTLPRPAKSQKGASKATLRNGETAWCRGLTCTHFRPPFEVLRGQTLRPEPTKNRLGMSLSAQHYQDQQRARKGRQKPPFETGKQHGVAGSRAPIFCLRLKCCEGKRRVQNLQKKGLE